jgi:hypothetical protein
MDKAHTHDSSSAWWFYGISAAALLLAIALEAKAARETWEYKEAIKSVCDAVIIASLLAVTVDRFVKERLIREFSSDAAKYLMGYRLPTAVQDKIRELMSTTIVRRDYNANYTLVGDNGRQKLTVELNFYVENYSNEPQTYQQLLGLAVYQAPTVSLMACHTTDDAARYEFKDVEGTVKGASIRFECNPITIRPITSGMTYRMQTRYELYPPFPSETITFHRTTCNAEILAEGAGFAFALHSITLASKTKKAGNWEFNRAFLPGEHIRFEWESPKPGPSPPHSQRRSAPDVLGY